MEGIQYYSFFFDMPYDVFTAIYLLGDAPEISSSVIYDRYAALGGNPTYIQGHSFLLIHLAESVGLEPGVDAATTSQGAAGVPEEVRAEAPAEGMGDTQGQGPPVGATEPVILPEGPFISVSDLLGSRLDPSWRGERASDGIHIREGGSTGGSGNLPQFFPDARGKASAVEGEGFEADLATFVRSMRDRPRDGVSPLGPGESSAVMSLPAFPREISYTVVTEQRSFPIHLVPPPEPMTFPDCFGDVVNFLNLFFCTKFSLC